MNCSDLVSSALSRFRSVKETCPPPTSEEVDLSEPGAVATGFVVASQPGRYRSRF